MSSSKKKIALVNILFPPKGLGGATRIFVDEALSLANDFGSEFEVVVFAANTQNPNYNKFTIYTYDTFRTYLLNISLTEHSNWQAENPDIGQAFKSFLEFEKPDFIHFHCIQGLTGSIVQEAINSEIPYFVTVHDAWWISDFQFLYDSNGQVYIDGHPDPYEKANLPDGVSKRESLKRRAYLKGLLSKAVNVFAVSQSFEEIYRKNGIQNITTVKNGISNIQWRPKNTKQIQKVVCAHIGGKSAHKGFDIFKSAVIKASPKNIEILVVDHSHAEGFSMQEFWGEIPVKILGLVPQEKILDLYSQIDVLFAPSIWPESFGLVTREANACSCWVVASNRGGIADDVTTESGIVIEPTIEEIQLTLTTIDSNPSKYKGQCAQQTIRYSSDQVLELVEHFRDSLKS